MEKEKTTIQAAAKALGVTTKTIQRYLVNGTLSKVKEGNRTYILIDEIRTLRQGQTEGQKNDVQTNHKDRDIDTITIKLSEYKELLQEVGHYKGQAEGQARYLLEFKQDAEQKAYELAAVRSSLDANSKELDQAKATISKARNELQHLVEIKQDAERKAEALRAREMELADLRAKDEQKEKELAEIRAELERLKAPWWKRLLKK